MSAHQQRRISRHADASRAGSSCASSLQSSQNLKGSTLDTVSGGKVNASVTSVHGRNSKHLSKHSGHVTNFIYTDNANVTFNSKVPTPLDSTEDRGQYKHGPSLESGNESSQDHQEESDVDSTSSIEALNGVRSVYEEDCNKTRRHETEPVEQLPQRRKDWENELHEWEELLYEREERLRGREERLREREEQLQREDKAIQDQKILIQAKDEKIKKLREKRITLISEFSDVISDEDNQHTQDLHDLRERLAEKESYIEMLHEEAQRRDVHTRQEVQFSKAVQQEALARRESAALLVTRLRTDRDDIRKERKCGRMGEIERERYLAKKESWAQKNLDDAKSNLTWIDRHLAFTQAQNEPIGADRPHTRSVGRGPPSDSGRGSRSSASQVAARFVSGGSRLVPDYATPRAPSGLPCDRFMGREIRSDSGYETHSQASDIPKARSSSSYLGERRTQSPDIPPRVPTPPPRRHPPMERLNHKDKKQQLRHADKPP